MRTWNIVLRNTRRWVIKRMKRCILFPSEYEKMNYSMEDCVFCSHWNTRRWDIGMTVVADSSPKVGKNRRTQGKTTWPSVSRTWLSHMWPERGSNHSGEKPNELSQLSYPLGYGGPLCSHWIIRRWVIRWTVVYMFPTEYKKMNYSKEGCVFCSLQITHENSKNSKQTKTCTKSQLRNKTKILQIYQVSIWNYWYCRTFNIFFY